MLDYTLTINNTALKNYIERDSYKTAKIPVYSDAVTTMDGVTHVALIRTRNEISFTFNPMNGTTTSTVCTALLTQPCTVYFYSLQDQAYATATMQLSQHSADYLSRCLYSNTNWNQLGQITLTEL